MKITTMKLQKYHYGYIFVIVVFLGLVSVNLFSDGMFLDGLLYATISRNMANGLGSFWRPHLSNCFYNEFYEHPPLAFGMQSIAFKLFGDSIFVERFYSLFTFVIVGYLIVVIWKKFTNDVKSGWIPLFLWIIVKNVTWAASNNMLENTMSIFVCLSFLFYLKSYNKNRFFWIFLSGISISLGLLTKGFFCLYGWGFPFLIWVFKREKSFGNVVLDTIVLIVVSCLPIMLLFFFFPEAQHNMSNYFFKQVIGSIQQVKTVDSRFYIIKKFFENVMLPLVIGIFVVLFAIKRNVQRDKFTANSKTGLMFLAIAISGVLPIMVSMKQREFYILTVYPFFALGLAYYLYPIIKFLFSELNEKGKVWQIFKVVVLLIGVISISLSIFSINKIGRDKEIITDCRTVITVVGKNSTINICPELYRKWSLHGYFARYGNVSLEKDEHHICQYYLSSDECNREYSLDQYELVPIHTTKYMLYKRKKQVY
jgi:4-amino-4-deoxy-L-arabinose transferase-like glycosyltransferase